MMFRTPVQIKPIQKITLHTHLMCLGSCFSTHMASRFAALKIPILSNPYGITYNPKSIIKQLRQIYQGTEPVLTMIGAQGYPFDFHGDFRHPNAEDTRVHIRRAWKQACLFVQHCDHLIITLGSAHVWLRNGHVVNNCHKRPAREFQRRCLTIQECISSLEEIATIIPPQIRCTLCLSPVRYIRDGLVDGQLSKSLLRVAIEHICQKDPRFQYFPSYEILLDELRDYRFYQEDMLHPNQVAQEYIWTQVKAHLISTAVTEREPMLTKLHKRLKHRPSHPTAPEYQRFLMNTQSLLRTLQDRYPTLDWKPEQTLLSQCFDACHSTSSQPP